MSAIASFSDLFAATTGDDGVWTFELAERFNGAFGGTNGGTLTALSVYVARQISGRQPTSIDSRYVRSFRPGLARVLPRVLNEGRTLSVLGIEIVDVNGKLCCYSTVTLVDPAALATALEHAAIESPPELAAAQDQRPWAAPAAQPIPLIATYRPTQLGRIGRNGGATVTGIDIPWREAGTSAEAACIAADMSVGPPVARLARASASTPNPDLSLRFCTTLDEVTRPYASCSVERVAGGLASTRLSVWSEQQLLALGISTTTCIPLR